MTATKNNWLLHSLGALVLWGGWAFLPKLALETLSITSVIFYEAVGGLLVAAIFLVLRKGKLKKDRRGISIVAFTSIFSILAIVSYYYALTLGPVSTIAMVAAMYPVIALVLARIFLKERVNGMQKIAVVMAAASIVLLAA